VGALRGAAHWVYERLGLDALARLARNYKVPAEIAHTRKGWMYVFGNATLLMLVVQIVTGVALATMYVPSPEVAHQSLQQINADATFGWFLRAVHFLAASAMVVLMVMHMTRTFLTAAYKYPREATWMFGVVLFVLVMMMAFTGQLLRWDENGLWGAVVAAKYVARVPLVGEQLARFVLAGETVGGVTLSRFFALHVFVLPGLIFLCLGVHLLLVVHHGISEPPKAGRTVDPTRYREWYASLKKKGVAYWPHVVWREAVFGLLAFSVVLALAFTVGPRGPGPEPDTARLAVDPKPDWFLLWWYSLLWIKPRGLEALVMVYGPVLALAFAFLLPVLFGKGERAASKRPWAIFAVVLVVGFFATFTVLGMRAPWFPEQTEALTAEQIGVSDPQVLQGAATFNERGCQLCHVVAGSGGAYGPDLTRVGQRLSPEEISLRIMNGIGDMPAYRDILTRRELGDIVAFLSALSQQGGQ
jgi:ubiquinol-cytochrome c reductase cytochrome b subunit